MTDSHFQGCPRQEEAGLPGAFGVLSFSTQQLESCPVVGHFCVVVVVVVVLILSAKSVKLLENEFTCWPPVIWLGGAVGNVTVKGN